MMIKEEKEEREKLNGSAKRKGMQGECKSILLESATIDAKQLRRARP